jgi:hypothetical protein
MKHCTKDVSLASLHLIKMKAEQGAEQRREYHKSDDFLAKRLLHCHRERKK